VAYSSPIGAYAEVLLRPADRLVKIPAGIDDKTAAAMMLKGLTAQYLIRRTYRVKKGDTILMHAAAGGVGQILCQWARALGATVIGTVGSDEKAALAKKAGCTHVIVTSREKFVERVKQITQGKGVPVVYDGVGKDTFMDSLDCLAPLGLMASFGNASGAVTQFNPGILAQKGSLFLTRPTLNTYAASREALLNGARELFAVVKSGKVKIAINQTYLLREAAQAQRDLESRKTTGSTILIP
jgi:NADPH2:quinone reductase